MQQASLRPAAAPPRPRERVVARVATQEGHRRGSFARPVEARQVAKAHPQDITIEANAGIELVHRKHDMPEAEVAGHEARDGAGRFERALERDEGAEKNLGGGAARVRKANESGN